MKKYTRPKGSTGEQLLGRRGRYLAALLVDYKCPVCGKAFGAGRKRHMTIDHLVPCAAGGHANLRDNIIPMCGSCNSSARDRDKAEWLVDRLPKVGATRAETISGRLAAALKVASTLETIAVDLTDLLDEQGAW